MQVKKSYHQSQNNSGDKYSHQTTIESLYNY